MDRVNFKVNGVEYSVGCEVSSDVTLLDYIRHSLELRGTKYMCREAGCGACIVAAVKRPGESAMAVNSCMVPIMACQDWEVETIENLGNRKKGYHILQKTLADNNGTQCGYCTPAWIMSMYCLLQKNKNLTMLEIEKSFGSNICRCTGYRPILESFKKFAIDAPKSHKIKDIEDLFVCKKNENCSKHCIEDWCIISKDDVETEALIELKLKDGKLWFKVNTINDIFRVLEKEGDDSYMLVIGNTAKGVFPIDDYPRVLIDISGVSELKGYTIDQNLIINAGTTLTELLAITETVAENSDFSYLQKFNEHLQNVAHIAVRNIGSVGGNLMTKHQHNAFSSDLFVLFETVGAFVTIQKKSGKKEEYSMQQFLKINMRGYVLLNVLLPPLGQDVKVVTFKIMPRSQNAHAIVNAGFLYKFKNTYADQVRIVFGGLSSNFIRASATEEFLVGKLLFTNETLQTALKILDSELIVEDRLPDPSVEYRKQLALALFYKSLLILCPEKTLQARYRSGSIKIHETRPVSKSLQMFETKPSLWPLNQPIPKVEALSQCSGEAFYTDDIPSFPREVFASFVLSTVSVGDIISIDPSTALNQTGVIAFYTAKDIPGLNSFTPEDNAYYATNEEVLCSGSVKYYNQPIGIIVAETQHIANTAAKMVYAKYANAKKPVLNILKAKDDTNRITLFSSSEATEKGTDVKKVIKGVNAIYGPYHFTMETLICIIRPTEEGMQVFCSSQWLDCIQLMISRALNIDQNRIDVHNRRVGGGYGIKISRSTASAVACALVVSKLNRPCRFIQSLTTNMRAVGKRMSYSCEFEVQVNDLGTIQYMDYNLYQDDGYVVNELLATLSLDTYYNCYNNTKWNEKFFDTITDTAKNTWCRASVTLEVISMAEKVMEQISYEMAIDPLEVRLANLDPKYSDMREMINTVMTKSDYKSRREAVTKFNLENRWKKRGLRFSLIKWSPYGTGVFEINLSIYHGDGSVIITHGGIEMGQGINTKAIQICAYLLNISIDKIIIKENNTIIGSNTQLSGASLTSQNVSYGVQKCCKLVLERLEPIKSQMDNPTWEELITKAFESNVDLQFHVYVGSEVALFFDVLGVALAEVEVDILTGESEVIRVDLLEDAGQSVNPDIDVGQVEGAFVMGLGYWTSEQLVYSTTGELLTDRTWNYYVPQARDIPQDIRVYFKRNSYSTDAIQGSKCIGEAPMCLSVVIIFALREAIASARLDSGFPLTQWFTIDGPFTVEKICLSSETKIEDFKFY